MVRFEDRDGVVSLKNISPPRRWTRQRNAIRKKGWRAGSPPIAKSSSTETVACRSIDRRRLSFLIVSQKLFRVFKMNKCSTAMLRRIHWPGSRNCDARWKLSWKHGDWRDIDIRARCVLDNRMFNRGAAERRHFFMKYVRMLNVRRSRINTVHFLNCQFCIFTETGR